MGGATIEGLLKSKSIGAGDITVADPYADLNKYKDKGLSVRNKKTASVKDSGVLKIFVKPWFVEDVLEEIKDTMDYDKQSIIVVAAGVESFSIERWLKKDGELPEIFLCIHNNSIEKICII